jgi:hypothetical protein
VMMPDDQAYVLPLADGLCALFLDDYQTEEEAQRVSGALRTDAMTVGVLMSDHLLMKVFRDGELVHEYDSAPEVHYGITVDDDGVSRMPDGSVYEPGRTELPMPEPLGADPKWFLRFMTADGDPDGLHNVLTGRSGGLAKGGYVFAEAAHADLCTDLGLTQLCLGFRYLEMDFFLPERTDLRTLFAAAIPIGDVEPIEPPPVVEGVAS